MKTLTEQIEATIEKMKQQKITHGIHGFERGYNIGIDDGIRELETLMKNVA